MSREGAAATFWALSDPLRVELLDRIADRGGATVSDLAADLPITRQAITRHLQTLESADLLVGEKTGRERRYRVSTEPLAEANRWLDRRAASWASALDRLATHVESSSETDD